MATDPLYYEQQEVHLKAMKEHQDRLMHDNTRLNAEVNYWKGMQKKTEEKAAESMKKMVTWLRNTVMKSYGIVEKFGVDRRAAGCSDCDVKALLAEIGALMPAELESRVPSVPGQSAVSDSPQP